MVRADILRRPVVIDIDLMFYKSSYSFGHVYHKYADGDYNTLYNELNYKWSQAYDNTSVYAAVDSMNAALLDAVDQSVPLRSFRITKYSSLFSDSLIYCMCKKEKRHFHSFQNIVNLSKLPSNPNRLPWLHSIHVSLKRSLTKFWKNASVFQNNNLIIKSSYTLTEPVLMILVMMLKLLLSTFIQPIVTLHYRLVSFPFFVLIFFTVSSC